MKRTLLLPVLAAMLFFSSSFNIFKEQSVLPKKTVTEPAKRCGPWFTVYNYGLAVNKITLIYGTYVQEVINPTFPYAFPQGGGGIYTVTVTFSSIPSSGVYLGAGGQCQYSTTRSVSVTFDASGCTDYPITISNFSCD